MAIDLVGIDNANDFYTQHYLEELLDGDLKSLFGKWAAAAEDGTDPPDRAVRALRKQYADLRRQTADEAVAGAEKERVLRAFHRSFLRALGWVIPEEAPVLEIDTGILVPLLLDVGREGTRHFVAVEGRMPRAGEALLQSRLLPSPRALEEGEEVAAQEMEEIITSVFRIENAPTWLLVLAGRELLLLHRSKWEQRSTLGFDLDELYDQPEANAMRALAALLCRDALAPGEGEQVLHETLDENSHKHAFAVSQDLKYGVREAIELLANAWIRAQREQKKQKVFDDGAVSLFTDETARGLTEECLTFLYRLLFLFYAEARGEEMGVVPVRSEAYRLGYSLEHLRDLELVALNGEDARNGSFFHDSIERLFKMLFEGYGSKQQPDMYGSAEHLFRIPALKSQLFKPERTKRLSSIRIDNATMQRVLQLLSLSREEHGRGRRRQQRGRISYARLGINQLGAVYEALLSYTGFFAPKGGLYELKPAEQEGEGDVLSLVYFARADEVSRFEEQEFVTAPDEKDPDGPPKRKFHPQGSFIYRLAGRDRERSASYYTPEVLTRCVVKYSLKEILTEILGAPQTKHTAQQILALTVCEPAMGSGAFLNEAVNQLADAYLERRQFETGERIPAVDRFDADGNLVEAGYTTEARRTRAFIATHNVYGVDLNPVAAELAKVSLWLNVLGPDTPVPWFDLHLAVGNSLFGCRRQVFRESDVRRKGTKENPNFLGMVPDAIPLSDALPDDGIFHWLLPDDGMCAVRDDKVAKDVALDDVERMKAWHKDFVKKAFSSDELETLKRLTVAADRLWLRHADVRRAARARSLPRMKVWRGPPTDEHEFHTLEDLESARDGLLHPTSPYRRLRLAMDAWCALWVWPLHESSNLPSRAQWLAGMAALLEGDRDVVVGQRDLLAAVSKPRQTELNVGTTVTRAGQTSLALAPADPKHFREGEQRAKDTGAVDSELVAAQAPFLASAKAVSAAQRFMHWELQFADLFASRRGFDLIVGNPPWRQHNWSERDVLADYDARIGLSDMTGSEASSRRSELLSSKAIRSEYLAELTKVLGEQDFYKSTQAFRLLSGIRTNLYKCFLVRSWDMTSPHGVSGIVHQPAVIDDPKGIALRTEFYARLRLLCSFTNQLKLFPEIGNTNPFCFSVCASRRSAEPNFQFITNLFHPSTLDACHSKSADLAAVPGIKTQAGSWELRGHPHRIVPISSVELESFHLLLETPKVPVAAARLPQLHSLATARLLTAFARHRPKMADIEWGTTREWNEGDRTEDGTIRVDDQEIADVREWIISGPHFHLGTPMYKTANPGCSSHRDYAPVAIERISEQFLPRTKYIRNVSRAEYESRAPRWKGKPLFDRYRHIHREMLNIGGERTLVAAIAPPGAATLGAVFSVAIENTTQMLAFSALASSLPIDFLVRMTGTGHANVALTSILPVPTGPLVSEMVRRALLLNSLTNHYSDLWSECFDSGLPDDSFTKRDRRLVPWSSRARRWSYDSPIRSAYERRQALVELDVLAALELGITDVDLVSIYRTYFPVLEDYDRELYFDQRGQVVFTVNKGLSGVGVSRELWEEIRLAQSPDDLSDEHRKLGYLPPFDCPNREADMCNAYAEFQHRLAAQGRGVA